MNFSPAEIGTFLMGFAALLTAIYALWGGRRRDKTQEALSFTEMEENLRAALFSDFKAQRDENQRLRSIIKAHESRILQLEAEVENLERERDELQKSRMKPKAKAKAKSTKSTKSTKEV